MKAILLAGGKGTRLRPLTIHTPKPIVPIFDRPFLHYQLDLLKQVPEIDEVILSLNYQPRRIEEVFGDGGESGLGDPLRRRAGAARHRRRHPLRVRIDARLGGRVQRRRADAARSGRGHRAAPRAQGQGDDRADAGRQSDAPTAWSRPTPRATSRASSRSPTPTRSPATRSTPASTSSSPTPSIAFPKDTPWSIERSFFPSLIERNETFVAYVYRGYWIDIGTPEKYMQVHRDIMDGHYIGHRAMPFAAHAAARRGCRRTRASRTARSSRAPASSTKARRQGRRAHRPLQRRRPSVPHRGARGARQRRSSGRTAASARKRSSAGRSSAATATSAATRSSRTASSSATSRSSPTTAGSESRQLESPYVHESEPRHLQGVRRPRRVSGRGQRGCRAGDRRGVRRLPRGADGLRVSRDMRLSSPALAAAFIDGATSQGADVVDYGMMATDMLYFAVATRRATTAASRSPRRTTRSSTTA